VATLGGVFQGYFVHFVAPDQLPPMPKHVVFVLDTSGRSDLTSGRRRISFALLASVKSDLTSGLRRISFFLLGFQMIFFLCSRQIRSYFRSTTDIISCFCFRQVGSYFRPWRIFFLFWLLDGKILLLVHMITFLVSASGRYTYRIILPVNTEDFLSVLPSDK